MKTLEHESKYFTISFQNGLSFHFTLVHHLLHTKAGIPSNLFFELIHTKDQNIGKLKDNKSLSIGNLFLFSSVYMQNDFTVHGMIMVISFSESGRILKDNDIFYSH